MRFADLYVFNFRRRIQVCLRPGRRSASRQFHGPVVRVLKKTTPETEEGGASRRADEGNEHFPHHDSRYTRQSVVKHTSARPL